MGTSARAGLPWPEDTDAVDVPGHMQSLAVRVAELLGTPVMTTLERDALAGDDLYAGRAIINSDVGRVQSYDGTNWIDAETPAGAQSKVDTHQALANPHSGSAANPHGHGQHSIPTEEYVQHLTDEQHAETAAPSSYPLGVSLMMVGAAWSSVIDSSAIVTTERVRDQNHAVQYLHQVSVSRLSFWRVRNTETSWTSWRRFVPDTEFNDHSVRHAPFGSDYVSYALANNTFPLNEPIDSWPLGITTMFRHNDTATPNPGGVDGKMLTVRPVSVQGFQHFVARALNRHWIRNWIDSGTPGWGPWRELTDQAALDAHTGNTADAHGITANELVAHLANDQLASTGPDAYPVGVSIFHITNGTANGWPYDLATVTTVKITSTRTYQFVAAKTTPRSWMRSAGDSNSWGSFEETAWRSNLDAHTGDTANPHAVTAAQVNAVQEDVFTADGTWTKPAGAKLVVVEAWGGGGGGGGGESVAAGSSGNGGNGGGGGGYNRHAFLPDELPDSVAVTVGGGGAAGTPTADAGDGAASLFDSAPLLRSGGASGGSRHGLARGGGGGSYGSSATNYGGQPNPLTTQDKLGGAGADTHANAGEPGGRAENGGGSGGRGDLSLGGAGGGSMHGAGAGGAGGGCTATAAANGARGGGANIYSTGDGGAGGAAAQPANTVTATAGAASTDPREGGGGGGSGFDGYNGANGGDGTAPGGGGGGGGASEGGTGGTGGVGARGELRVTTYR